MLRLCWMRFMFSRSFGMLLVGGTVVFVKLLGPIWTFKVVAFTGNGK
jgi:hypothetical protein